MKSAKTKTSIGTNGFAGVPCFCSILFSRLLSYVSAFCDVVPISLGPPLESQPISEILTSVSV